MFKKLTFVLVAVMVATPVDQDQQTGEYSVRQSAASFCQRNPHTCGAASEVWDGVVAKSSALFNYAYSTYYNGNVQGLQPAQTRWQDPNAESKLSYADRQLVPNQASQLWAE